MLMKLTKEQQQSAIEKVKKNEALTHPKLSKNLEPKISVSKHNDFSSNNRNRIIVPEPSPPPSSQNVIKVVRKNHQSSISPSISSTVSSLSSPTSSSSSSSVSMTKQRLAQLNNNNNNNSSNDEEETFLVPRPKPPSVNSSQLSHNSSSSSSSRPSQRFSVPTFSSSGSLKNGTEGQRAFEAELVDGKSRLRKLSTGLNQSSNRQMRPLTSVFEGKGGLEAHEVGVPARMPPAPIPPPPPPTFSGHIPPPPRPPPTVSLKPVNGEIPQAPKLTHFGAPQPAAEPKRKGMIAPNGLSAR